MDPWWAKDLSKMKETLFVRNARARKCWKKWRRKAKKLTKLSGLGKYTLIKKPNFLGLWKTLLKSRPKNCKYVKETYVNMRAFTNSWNCPQLWMLQSWSCLCYIEIKSHCIVFTICWVALSPKGHWAKTFVPFISDIWKTTERPMTRTGKPVRKITFQGHYSCWNDASTTTTKLQFNWIIRWMSRHDAKS